MRQRGLLALRQTPGSLKILLALCSGLAERILWQEWRCRARPPVPAPAQTLSILYNVDATKPEVQGPNITPIWGSGLVPGIYQRSWAVKKPVKPLWCCVL